MAERALGDKTKSKTVEENSASLVLLRTECSKTGRTIVAKSKFDA